MTDSCDIGGVNTMVRRKKGQNMRSLKISLIVVLSIITLGLCGVLVYGMTGHHIYPNANKDYTGMHLVLEEEIPLDGIDSISVLYGMNSNDIFLYEGEGDSLIVKEYCEFDLDDEELSTVTVSEKSLEIKGKKRNHIGFFQPFSIGYAGGYVKLWLPASYKGQLTLVTASGDIALEPELAIEEDFSASSVSGNLKISAISAENVDIASTSGDVQISQINTDGEINIATTSGDMQLQQLNGSADISSVSGYIRAEAISGNIHLATTSGDIILQRVDGNADVSTTSGEVKIQEGSGDRSISSISGDILVKEMEGSFDISTTSGEVRVQAQEGQGKAETSSGDISVELSKLTGNLNMNSTSGDVNIKLPESDSFDFEANTSSGDINTFFDDNLKFSKKGNNAQGTYGTNKNGSRIDIDTTSGDVRITKK